MSEPASVEEGLAAIGAFGVLLLVNHQLVSTLSPYEMVDSATKVPRKWTERIVWFIFWIPDHFLGFWIGIWSIAVLSALCVNVVVFSRLVQPLRSEGSLGDFFISALCVALGSLIGLEHLTRLRTVFRELDLATRKNDIPILYLCSLALLFMKVSVIRILGFIVMSLIVSLFYWSRAPN